MLYDGNYCQLGSKQCGWRVGLAVATLPRGPQGQKYICLNIEQNSIPLTAQQQAHHVAYSPEAASNNPHTPTSQFTDAEL